MGRRSDDAVDLHALRVDTLQRALRELESKAARQDQELLIMACRRRSSSSGSEQEATVASA